MNKKGAVEMSMQTIIIVVIGVTLLTLGLRFVYTTFQGIGGQQEKITELTDKEIGALFGDSEDPIYLPRDDISIKQGGRENVEVLVRNVGSGSSLFKYEVKLDDAPEGVTQDQINSWLSYRKAGKTLNSGGAYRDLLTVSPAKNAKLGLYRFTLELTCGDTTLCPTDAVFTLEVK